MISVGLINRWKEYEYLKLQLSNPKRNEEGKSDEFEDFSISQLQSFFYIYLFTAFVSIVCFIGESLYFCLTR